MYLTQGLHRSLRHTPAEPATIFGERVRTHRELGERVSRVAGALRQLGVASGERVGILALNSDRYAELLLAVPWADGVLLPVNVRWSPREIAYSLDESETGILFVDDVFAPAVPTLRKGYGGLRTVVHMGDGPLPDNILAYEDLLTAAA